MARSDGSEVTVVERGDLRDVEPFGNGDDGCVGRAEREVAVGLDEFGNAGAAGPAEQVADLSDNRCRDEDLTASEMQAGEQIGAGSVVVVVAVAGCDQRAGVADNHSGAPEAFGEQVVMIAAEVVTTAGERREPRRRPGGCRLLLVLAADRSEYGGHPLVGQVLDEAPQLVPLGTHDVEGSRLDTALRHAALERSTNRSTNSRRPMPGKSRSVAPLPRCAQHADGEHVSVPTTDQKVRGSNPFGRAQSEQQYGDEDQSSPLRAEGYRL